ncbi:MAG: methyltransferase domain-containing protein [Acidimicrobiia bacterium]|nr:methyltransferase domain-containing protein [Acidimicrobiia bacterium]
MSDTGYGVADDEVELERRRLAHLAHTLDPRTTELLARTGITSGWHCLEVGAGSGSVSAWMAEQVGPEGRVMSTDIDMRFHPDLGPNVIAREADIVHDRFPTEHFDLVHARAVLQHIPERREVVTTLITLLKPGGWLVLEDGHFGLFAEQPLPEPYQTLHRVIAGAAHDQWRDPSVGSHLLAWMRDEGLSDLDVVGDVWAMRPGEDGGEWWFLALERAGPALVDAGIITDEQYRQALAQVRDPGFVMCSSLSIGVVGRRPA